MSPLWRRGGGPGSRPIPAHPYRDAALVYAAMAVVLVIVATATGGEALRALLAALIFFVARDGVELVAVPRADQGADARSARRAGRSPAPRRRCRTANGSGNGNDNRWTRRDGMSVNADARSRRSAATSRTIRAPRGTTLNALSWQTEAPLRMLLNNLDPEVAEHPEELVVYGGSGRAARSHAGVARRSCGRCSACATTRRCSCSRASRSACSARIRQRRGC